MKVGVRIYMIFLLLITETNTETSFFLLQYMQSRFLIIGFLFIIRYLISKAFSYPLTAHARLLL
jgi:hypothetical protein